MSNRLLLINQSIVELDAESDPRLDSSFPLTPEQYAALTIDSLLQLLGDEMRQDPTLFERPSRKLIGLCALIHQIGRVNSVRLFWGPNGLATQTAMIQDDLMTKLRELHQAGQLTETMTYEMIWSKLSAA